MTEVRIPAKEAFCKITLPHDWAIDMHLDEEMDQGAAQGFRNRWGIGCYRNWVVLSEKK